MDDALPKGAQPFKQRTSAGKQVAYGAALGGGFGFALSLWSVMASPNGRTAGQKAEAGSFGHRSKSRTPSEHPNLTEIHGWCTYPKMVPLVLTHSHFPRTKTVPSFEVHEASHGKPKSHPQSGCPCAHSCRSR